MEELNEIEILHVSGAGMTYKLAFFVGRMMGIGMHTREYVDSMDNIMLSGMQYGA